MGVTEYFFDSYACIEIMKKNMAYEKYINEKIRITFLNLLEIVYITYLDRGRAAADVAFKHFKEFVIEIPDEVVLKAIEFRSTNKKKSFSYADALGYVFALHNNLIFLTGDDAFKGLPNVEFVK